MKSKKGFTLVEIIVVIAISAIVLSMVATSMIFVTSSSGSLIQEAEDIDMAKNIETYLRSGLETNHLIQNDDGVYKVEKDDSGNQKEIGEVSFYEGDLVIKNNNDVKEIIFSDTGLDSFKIENGKCELIFKERNRRFEFTLWIIEDGEVIE